MTVWKGEPKYKPRLAILEIAGGEYDFGALYFIVPFILISLIFGICHFAYFGNLLIATLFLVILFAIIFIPEIHKNVRRSKTKYTLTDSQLKVETYWYGKIESHDIPLSMINKFYLVNYIDNCGVIHIFPNAQLDFKTRNFWSGNPRPNVTLEDIVNADKVFKTFQKTLVSYNSSKG